jgi:hypothetical protein
MMGSSFLDGPAAVKADNQAVIVTSKVESIKEEEAK